LNFAQAFERKEAFAIKTLKDIKGGMLQNLEMAEEHRKK
jgi:hypothetical protein